MELNELLKMIDEYFDGELKRDEESILFMSLSDSEEAKTYFKKQHILKNIISEIQEEFPRERDEKIFKHILSGKKESLFIKILSPVFTYPVMFIMLFLSFFYYSQSKTYIEDLNKIHLDIQKQNRTIELLLNSLPTTEVQAKFSNEVIIRSN